MPIGFALVRWRSSHYPPSGVFALSAAFRRPLPSSRRTGNARWPDADQATGRFGCSIFEVAGREHPTKRSAYADVFCRIRRSVSAAPSATLRQFYVACQKNLWCFACRYSRDADGSQLQYR